MTKSDKGLIVLVAIGLGAAGFTWLRWRDGRFLDLAQSIDACDDEPAVQRKTAPLGQPAREDRGPDSRVVAWDRNGKVLTVSFVTPPSGKLVVGAVRVTISRHDDPPEVLYQDDSGLRRCR